ncbi:hypothetical protein HY745_14880 [Candidatus Desantisbacteria bacterium]|nr:hypothetical protein [Candidatus Desantisbacteria bacterium]
MEKIKFLNQFIFLLFIITFCPCAIRGNNPEEKPAVKINTYNDTTILFHVNNFNKEGSFYLTSDYVYGTDFISNIFLHSRTGSQEIIQYGNYIFAWGNYRGHILMVFDISNLKKIKLCFTYDDNGIGKYLKIKNDKLILLNIPDSSDAKTDETIIVFDIKNPSTPLLITKINKNAMDDNNESDIRDMYLDEKNLYLLTSKGFMCFEFDMPKNPKLISKIDLNKNMYYFAGYRNKKLLVTNYNLEARLNKQTNKNINIISIDITNPANPAIKDVSNFIEDNSIYKNYNLILEKSNTNIPIPPIYYTFQKDLLFISLNMSIFEGNEEKERLLVFNFDDYNNPKYIDMFKLNYDCQFIFYMDKYFFTFSSKQRSEIFAIDENHSIKKLNKNDIFKLDLSKYKVFRKNFFERTGEPGYGQVKEGITSYDFFDPEKVEVKNFFSFSGNIEYIEIKNNIAYIADREQGLIVISC